ncbi:ABC transporter permease [bacterium]|nr:ABC transporter permease [bacterium]
MDSGELIAVFASILLQAAPLMIAVVGETITERAGVINLSLDGTMLLSAMTGFVAAYETDNVWIGFLAAMIVGGFFALIVAFGTIRLKQNQVAIGLVLTVLGDDLSSFLGQNYTRLPGPSLGRYSVPLLSDIPVVGPLLFNQNIVFYIAVGLTIFVWWFLGRTQPGLKLRSVGERPEAAFARGINVNFIRYFYTLVGGALVGFAGASYSLAIKIGWSEGHTRGLGWIALAIVIFGGWAPIRGAFGAILFGATKTLATVLQRKYPEVSVVAFNAIPWILMIAVLLLVGSEWVEDMILKLPKGLQRPMRKIFRVSPPMALGEDFLKK